MGDVSSKGGVHAPRDASAIPVSMGSGSLPASAKVHPAAASSVKPGDLPSAGAPSGRRLGIKPAAQQSGHCDGPGKSKTLNTIRPLAKTPAKKQLKAQVKTPAKTPAKASAKLLAKTSAKTPSETQGPVANSQATPRPVKEGNSGKQNGRRGLSQHNSSGKRRRVSPAPVRSRLWWKH